MRFDVHVVPGAKVPGPYGWHGGLPRLRVRAPASEGRANDEAQALLSELIGRPVALARGARSRRKSFDVDLDEAELRERLERHFSR